MKLNFLLVHPTHYFEYLLKNLQANLGSQIELNVYFLDEVNSQYPWTSNFRSGFKSEVLNGSFFSYKLYKSIILNKNSRSLTILVGWDRLDKLCLILLMALFGKKYLIYTDTPNTFKNRSLLKNTFRDLVLKFIGKTSNGLITTGEVGIKRIKTWNIDFKNIYNLPFFVNLEQFQPGAESTEENDSFTIFSSGRLVNSHKGYDIALRALGNLKKEKRIKDFKYYIAGTGEDKENIERLIDTNGLTNEIELLGWIEPSQLIALYQKCDIFLHPSRFDPYPNAILEAMACGAAVISSDRAGSAIDRIIDNRNGLLFASGDDKSLGKCISDLYNDKEKRQKIGSYARRTALEWPISKGIEVIQEIINQKRHEKIDMA